MSIDPIALLAQAAPAQFAGDGMRAAAPAQPFGAWFERELGEVNRALGVADRDARLLAAGQPVALHEVMMHLEEAKLSFQLLAQVRNKVLEGYQEVMRMQV